MAIARGRLALGLALCIGLLVTGCSHQPDRVGAPKFDPAAAGQKAIEMYDTNHDGAISGKELDKCPALKIALKQYETNGDHKVTAESIARRVGDWKTGIFTVPVIVRLDGKPLEGATVTFEPEPFLVAGTDLKTVTGKTDRTGGFIPKLDNTNHKGLPPGLYKVRILEASRRQRDYPRQVQHRHHARRRNLLRQPPNQGRAPLRFEKPIALRSQ